MKISSDKYIAVKEFERFKNFINNKFYLNDSEFTVKYANGINKRPIKKELIDIVFLMADKYPVLKAVGSISEYEVAEDTINFNFSIPVSSFLKNIDYDKKIYQAIRNLYDAEFMIFGKEKVKVKMKEIEMMGNQASPKDKDMYDDLEIVLEMYERGFKFLPIDLYKSNSTKFQVEDDGIRAPINSISGMGTVAAEGIYNAAQEKQFNSVDDVKKRSKMETQL